jgi:uncharacterized SAM-binding protein YcdF (DUF218 family)
LTRQRCSATLGEAFGVTMEPIDAIVVLGCRVLPDGTPSPALLRRLRRAAALAREWPRAVVVVTGGDRHGRSEAGVMAAWLAAVGIGPARIREEQRARSTLENARFVVPILAALGAEHVAVVTDAYHVRRGLVLLGRGLRAAGVTGVRLSPAPVESDKGWWERGRLALAERGKLLWDLWAPKAR